jgi:TonB family protein
MKGDPRDPQSYLNRFPVGQVSGHDLSALGGASFTSDGLRTRAEKCLAKTNSFTAVGLRAGEAETPKKNHPNLGILFTLVPAMNRKAAFLLLAASLLQTATAHADSLKDALNHKYKSHILALRSPFTARDQKFDSSGQPLNARSTGYWLLYGGIFVEKLNLSADTLRLEGHRAASYIDKKNGKLMLVRYDKARRIEIHLDQPLNSLDDAQMVLNRVFFLEGDAVEHVKPEFRRADDNTPDTEIYHVKKDVVLPPRATHTPEPEFSEQARHAKYQGTVVLYIVVDQAGNISRIRLERPLGMGLDENAMEGVKQWRFIPATRNGVPVAVAMNIEVSFNLY